MFSYLRPWQRDSRGLRRNGSPCGDAHSFRNYILKTYLLLVGKVTIEFVTSLLVCVFCLENVLGGFTPTVKRPGGVDQGDGIHRVVLYANQVRVSETGATNKTEMFGREYVAGLCRGLG